LATCIIHKIKGANSCSCKEEDKQSIATGTRPALSGNKVKLIFDYSIADPYKKQLFPDQEIMPG
jgi:CRISPR/Cas system-associated protein Cas7 (RAMP superfamily)